MKTSHKRILVMAGEPSGDLHAANLILAMKQQDPSLSFHGIGGPSMAKAGARLFFSIDQLSAMGLMEVIQQIRPVKQAFDLFRHHLKTLDPGLVILVDYPGSTSGPLPLPKNTARQTYFTIFRPKFGPGTGLVSNR